MPEAPRTTALHPHQAQRVIPQTAPCTDLAAQQAQRSRHPLCSSFGFSLWMLLLLH